MPFAAVLPLHPWQASTSRYSPGAVAPVCAALPSAQPALAAATAATSIRGLHSRARAPDAATHSRNTVGKTARKAIAEGRATKPRCTTAGRSSRLTISTPHNPQTAAAPQLPLTSLATTAPVHTQTCTAVIATATTPASSNLNSAAWQCAAIQSTDNALQVLPEHRGRDQHGLICNCSCRTSHRQHLLQHWAGGNATGQQQGFP